MSLKKANFLLGCKKRKYKATADFLFQVQKTTTGCAIAWLREIINPERFFWKIVATGQISFFPALFVFFSKP